VRLEKILGQLIIGNKLFLRLHDFPFKKTKKPGQESNLPTRIRSHAANPWSRQKTPQLNQKPVMCKIGYLLVGVGASLRLHP
jgi:hypothetical protein